MSIVKKIRNLDIEVTADILCNVCGQSCKLGETSHGYGIYEYMTIHVLWGYDSNHDTEEWDAHICNKCADTKFDFVKFDKKDGVLSGIFSN